MKRLIAVLAIAASATPALAHTGHGSNGFAAGVVHPFGGADHLLAMFAVGLWASLAAGRAWLAPVGFLTGVVAGGLLGAAGLVGAGVEEMIVVSTVVLGALAAVAARGPAVAVLALAAVFGAAHGAAHGAEAPADASAAAFLGGALLSTAALHVSGAAVGVALSRGRARMAGRALGAIAALAGCALAFG